LRDRQLARHAAGVHDDHAVGECEDLVELRRHHQHRAAGVAHGTQAAVDELDGADVDATRGLPHQQHLRRVLAPLRFAREHELLLVAAAELAAAQGRVARAHVVALHHLGAVVAHAALAHPGQHRARCVPRGVLVAERGRLPGVEGQHEAALVAVFGHVGQAQRACGAGVDPAAGLEALAAEFQCAGRGHEQAREHVEQLALAVARDAGDADYLASMQADRHIGQARHTELVGPGQVRGPQQRRADFARGGVTPPQVDAPAHHRLGEAVDRGVADGAIEHHLAAAHHRDGVAQGHDLLELVRDQQHRGAAVAQRSQRHEQLLGLGRREHGGGLVEDEDARAAVQRLEDLQALALAHGQLVHQRVERHHQAGVAHQHVELGAHLGARGRQAPAGLGAEHDVVERAERVHQHEVLVHHADA
jgi:hypothetical protein